MQHRTFEFFMLMKLAHISKSFIEHVVCIIRTFAMPPSVTNASIEISNKLQKLYKRQTKKKTEFDILDADKENFSKLRSQYVIANKKSICKDEQLLAANRKYTKWIRERSSLGKIEKEIKAWQDKVCRCRFRFRLVL